MDSSYQLEERILLILSTPCSLIGLVFGFILIINIVLTKSLHKPRHIFQALSVFSSLASQIFGLYGIIFLARSCGFYDSTHISIFYLLIWNRYLLLLSDVLPSIDRLCAIVFPLKYHIHATSNKGKVVCAIILALTIVSTLNAYYFGLVSPAMGEKASDHFRLISTQKFVLMLTAPYFTFLIVCLFGDSIALFVAKRKMNMKSIKVPGTSTDDIFVASKGIKQTKSEIKHSSESVSSAEEDGKSSDQATLSRRRARELKLSAKCLTLTVWYFLSQLCTYTPGLVFYNCGDDVGINFEKNLILNETLTLSSNIETVNNRTLTIFDNEDINERHESCKRLVGFWPRFFIFLFYQLQFIKSILFMALDKSLRETIIKNMTKKLYFET